MGSKRDDQSSNPFFEVVQKQCQVRFMYRHDNYVWARTLQKFPQKCQKNAGCWKCAVYGSRLLIASKPDSWPLIASKPDSSPPKRSGLNKRVNHGLTQLAPMPPLLVLCLVFSDQKSMTKRKWAFEKVVQEQVASDHGGLVVLSRPGRSGDMSQVSRRSEVMSQVSRRSEVGNHTRRTFKTRLGYLLALLRGLSQVPRALPEIEWFWDPIFRTDWDVLDVVTLSHGTFRSIKSCPSPSFKSTSAHFTSLLVHVWFSQPSFQNRSIAEAKKVRKTNRTVFCTRSKTGSENRSSRFESKISLISFPRGSGLPLNHNEFR